MPSHRSSVRLRGFNRTLARALSFLAKIAIAAAATEWSYRGEVAIAVVAWVCLGLTLLSCCRFRGYGGLGSSGDMLVTWSIWAHACLGMRQGLYESSAVYDKVVHGVLMALIAWAVLRVVERYLLDRGFRLKAKEAFIVVVAITLALGAAWEMFEFGVDLTGYFRAQRGLNDTMLDLCANAAGAIVGASAAWWMASRRPMPPAQASVVS